VACDVQDLYGRFTLDAASEFLFGKNMETLSGSLPIPGETAMGPKGSAAEDTWGSFAQAFDMAQVNITNRGRIGSMWPLFELFKDKNEEHCTVVKQWLDPIVERVLENKRIMTDAGISSSIAEKNFLQHLTDSTDGQFLVLGIILFLIGTQFRSRPNTGPTLEYLAGLTRYSVFYPPVVYHF
jgi:hypothetical protein